MKFIIKFLLITGSLINLVLGASATQQTNKETQKTPQQNLNCIKDKFKIVGLDKVKTNTQVEYKIATKENLPFEGLVKFTVVFNSGVIFESTGKKLIYSFQNPGSYIIKAFIKETNGCEYEIQKQVKAYQKIFVYIGIENKNIDLANSIIENSKKSIYIDKILIPSKGFLSQQELLNILIKHSYYIKYSDTIFIFFPQINYILDGLKKLQKIYNIDLNTKQIIIIIQQESNLFKKLLLKYMAVLKIKKLIILNNKNFLDFFSTYVGLKEGQISQYITIYTIEETTQKNLFFLSKIVDWLLYNGFPSNLLAILLLISLVLVIITFFRQMIGFSVFGVYNPLIFGLSLYLLGIKFSILVLGFAIIAIKLTNIIIRKVYLLYSAKLTLFYILYILILIISVYYLQKWGIVNILNLEILKNILIIFPIISIGIVAHKLITEDTKIFSIKFLVSLVEFTILSIISFFIFSNNYLQTLFLVYPELIFGCLIITILIGRFTGLQLFEYFRFWPLIKKQFEEE